jgi:hypothetical protein
MVGSANAGNAGTINVSVGVAGTTAGGLQLWASNSQTHYVQFGDGTAGAQPYAGYVGYIHSSDSLIFGTATATKLTIASTGAATFTSTITATELYLSTSNGLIGNINSSNANGGYITWQTSGTTIADIGTTQQVFGSSGNDTFGINGRGSRAIAFGTNNTERMRITSGGNVGIGTTSPYQNLQVYQTGTAGNNYVEGTIQVGGTSSTLGAVLSYAAQNSGYVNLVNLNTSGGANARISLGFGAISSGLPASTVMTLNQSGNVGIGTTAPNAKLDIVSTGAGSEGLRVDGATGGFAFVVRGGDTYTSHIRAGLTVGANYFTTPPANGVIIEGNVGIGTTSPAEKLDVYGKLRLFSAGYTYIDIGVNASNYWRIINDNPNDTLNIGKNGATNLIITSGGNVGIGTSSPSALLHLSSASPYIYLDDTSTSGTLKRFQMVFGDVGSTQTLNFGFNNTSGTSLLDVLSINEVGKVGIGTTSPSALLELKSSTGTAAFGNGINIFTQAGTYSTGHGGILQFQNEDVITAGIRGVRDPGSWASSMLFYTHNSSVGNTFNSTFVERMRINHEGNVGIGTTSPIGPLTVAALSNADTIFLLGRSADNATRIDFYNNARSTRLYTVASGNGAIEHYADANVPMVFSTNGTERLRILAGGNIGIGMTSPQARLDVLSTLNIQATGNSDLPYINFSNNGRSFDWGRIGGLLQGDGDGALYFQTKLGGGLTEKMRILSGGTVYINATSNPLPDNAQPQLGILAGASTDAVNIKHTQNANNTLNIWQTGTTTCNMIAFYKGDTQTNRGLITVSTSGTTYNSVSDYRLKENVVPLENGLDRLMQLKPSKFNWIETGNESEGFIAHELQEYFPDAVTGEKDAVYSSTGNIKPQSVDYGRITPLLVKAIQELKAQNDALLSRIEQLENK